MRRAWTAALAAALLVSTVGSALAVEPAASPDPAPVIEPSPTVNPSPTAGPAASASDPAAPATPASPPLVAPPATADGSSADPAGRWIVVLKSGANAAIKSKDEGRKLGFKVDRTFGHAFDGFSAKLDRGQVAALQRETSVAMIVPDEKIQAEAQMIPTGISRVGATR